MENKNKDRDSPKSIDTTNGTTKPSTLATSQQTKRRVTRSNTQLSPASTNSRMVSLKIRPQILVGFPTGKSAFVAQPFLSKPSPLKETPESKEIIEEPIIYSQRNFKIDTTQKHTPIGYRGQRFLLKDNPNLDRSHLKRGRVEKHKLEILVKDTNGTFQYRFFRDRAANKWDNANWIAEANKWRNQALRRLFKHDMAFKCRTGRTKWGVREMSSLKFEVEKVLKQTGKILNACEWEKVASVHNAEYAGTKINAGERLIGGGQVKSSQMIEARSAIAIKALFDRTEALKAFVNSLILKPADDSIAARTKVNTANNSIETFDVEIKTAGMDEEMGDTSSDTQTESNDDVDEMEGLRHDGDFDPRLEGRSDDGDGGQRPQERKLERS